MSPASSIEFVRYMKTCYQKIKEISVGMENII
jgi:hypothetical protein